MLFMVSVHTCLVYSSRQSLLAPIYSAIVISYVMVSLEIWQKVNEYFNFIGNWINDFDGFATTCRDFQKHAD